MRGDDVANNYMTTIIKTGRHRLVIMNHGNNSVLSEENNRTSKRQQEERKEDTRINLKDPY